MGLSRSSAGAGPGAASRGRASFGNQDAEGSRHGGRAKGRGVWTQAVKGWVPPPLWLRGLSRDGPLPRPRCEVLPPPRGAEALEGMLGVSRPSRSGEVPASGVPACCLLVGPCHPGLRFFPPSAQPAFVLFRDTLSSSKPTLTPPPGLCLGWGPKSILPPTPGGRGPPFGLAVAALLLCLQP